MKDALVEYYDRRLPEYDELYRRPERQRDLATLRDFVRTSLAGARVLELACGTGYWTQVVAETAAAVVASDLSARALDVARKRVSHRNVRFTTGDALAPGPSNEDRFTAVPAAFWWSHVPRADVPGFLARLATALGPGVRGVFMDNRHVAGSSTATSRTDGEGNTTGSKHWMSTRWTKTLGGRLAKISSRAGTRWNVIRAVVASVVSALLLLVLYRL